MTVLADQRAVTLRGSRTSSAGYRVKVQMPNPNQPGALMTLGALQCSARQWFLLRELAKAGGQATGIEITIVTGDVPVGAERRPMAVKP